MVISGNFIGGYWLLFYWGYWWLLVAINGYFIGGY
jgi:hypothetical protein